jgi:hypothetical protein
MFRRYGIVDNADKLMALEQEGTYVREPLKKQGPKGMANRTTIGDWLQIS